MSSYATRSAGASKYTAERDQRILLEVLQQPGNDICADCKSRAPRWSSWNLGIFICVQCASIHRKIGTHVTKVKSVYLDAWTKEQVESVKNMGNIASNAKWNPNEARNPPPTILEESKRDSEMGKYIRAKYETKRFLNRKSVAPSTPSSNPVAPSPASPVPIPRRPKPEPSEPADPSQTVPLGFGREPRVGFSLGGSGVGDLPVFDGIVQQSGKAFALAQECEQHEALHLSTQPIECRGCQKAFAAADSLNEHLRSEDGIECRHVQNEIRPDGMPTASYSLEQYGTPRPESEVEAPAMRETKRLPEEEQGQNNGEEGREPERGKIIHRDYAGVIPNHIESASQIEYSTNETMQDTEMNGPTSDTRPTITIQSGQITCEQMFQHLVAHGCADLTSDIDPGGYSSGLIQGGAFGDIWKGKLRDGTEVAIKVWRSSSLLHNGAKSMKRAMREIYYWSKAKHKYVQELLGVVMFQGRLGMVSLWMEHGNMREYICKNPDVDRYALCYQVASGIAYLHSREMVHGDLKGTNILVSREGVAKLSDFDHSIMSECSIAFSETSKLGGGTTRWMAPELILDDDCNRSAYTDVYALGMTMLEIITGASPYTPQCKDDVNVIKAIMKQQRPTRPMDRLSDNLRDNRMWELLLRCWDYDPPLRPKAAEVVELLQDIITLSATRNPA